MCLITKIYLIDIVEFHYRAEGIQGICQAQAKIIYNDIHISFLAQAFSYRVGTSEKVYIYSPWQ